MSYNIISSCKQQSSENDWGWFIDMELNNTSSCNHIRHNHNKINQHSYMPTIDEFHSFQSSLQLYDDTYLEHEDITSIKLLWLRIIGIIGIMIICFNFHL